MSNKHSYLVMLLAGLMTFNCLLSCQKIHIVTATTSDVNIYDYLVRHGDQFSEFAKMIDKAGYSSFLNAYGAYTVFAPTNDGVKAFLQDVGKTTIDAFALAELQDYVKLHLIQDTLNTNQFTDGKLPKITMLGQYLLTGVVNKNSVSSYIINRLALVVQSNIHVPNGNIHAIDNVLRPATKTIAQTIEADANYSIFTQALKATGFYDSLNVVNNPDTNRRFLTLVAETNKVLAEAGITSFAALKARYSKTGNTLRADDSLHIYIGYHISADARYLADVVSTSSIPTLQPLEVLTTSLNGQTVLLNDIYFNGNHETGIELDRPTSDVIAKNGVMHSAKMHFTAKVRLPFRVDFDVADQPELRKLTNVYLQTTTTNAITSNGGGTSFTKGFFADVTWNANTLSTSTISYVCMPSSSTTYYGWRTDYLRLPMGTTSRNLWVEFCTPLIVKGRYKVWINYYWARQSATSPALPNRVDIDGQPMQRTFDFSEQKPVGTPGELEALGYKQYTEAPTNNSTPDTRNVSRLVGTFDIATTDRHSVRITFANTSSTGQELNYLDMIQFIPVNDNQQRPVFGRNGRIIP